MWSVLGVLFNWVLYFLAKEIKFDVVTVNLLLLFFFMFAVIVLNVGSHGTFYAKKDAGVLGDSVATYQGFARSLVCVWCCCAILIVTQCASQ
ncbi:MAG: hypothetical protein OEY29_03665 [Gammaproteobacteria bacterium]|nr:hypothetical protein [Gammaproteobacteria bacterium]